MQHRAYTVILAVWFGLASVSSAESVARQLYQFSNGTWLENLVIRQNDDMILTSASRNTLFTFNPKTPVPYAALQIPDANGVTGIAEIAPDEYVIAAGFLDPIAVTFSNAAILVVDFHGNQPRIKKAFSVPIDGFPNGVAALPDCAGVVLLSDSLGGKIWRIDTNRKTANVAWQDASLAPGSDNSEFGVNGVKIFDGFLYYANSNTGLLSRVLISEDGRRFGDSTVLARLSNSAESFDDFSIDSQGVIYAAVHPNAVERIWPDGRQDVLVGGNSTLLEFTTSTAVSQNGHILYVTTAGVSSANTGYMGQIVQVDI